MAASPTSVGTPAATAAPDGARLPLALGAVLLALLMARSTARAGWESLRPLLLRRALLPPPLRSRLERLAPVPEAAGSARS